MKKTLLTNLKFIAFGIVFAISLSYVHAIYYWNSGDGVYSNPAGTPPASNTATPFNVSILDQVKPRGSCAPYNCGGLILNGGFLAGLDAQLDGTTFLNSIVGGGNGTMSPNSTIRFGGTDIHNAVQSASLTMSGGLTTPSLLKSGVLANAAGNRPICSDQNGYVVLCDAPAAVCSNVSGGPYTTVPADYQANPDGTCSKKKLEFFAVLSQNKTVKNFSSNPNAVVNGHPVCHAFSTYNCWPVWTATLGFDTDNPNGWFKNDISGIQPTGLDSASTQLLSYAQPGSYDVNINIQGSIGISAKYPNDDNIVSANFYMVVNRGKTTEQWIPLSTTYAQSGSSFWTALVEPYPRPPAVGTDMQPVNVTANNSTGADSLGNNQYLGTRYIYAPYTLAFKKTLQLGQGDTIDLVTFVYGASLATGFGGNVNGAGSSFNNFFYTVQEDQGSSFDIIETPQ
jgi:hypothetical protein